MLLKVLIVDFWDSVAAEIEGFDTLEGNLAEGIDQIGGQIDGLEVDVGLEGLD